MPELKDHRETKEVELPTSGATIKIAHSLLSGHMDELQEKYQDGEVPSSVMLAWLIKEWDFTIDGETADITPENVGKALDFQDVNHAMQESGVQDFLEEQADIEMEEVKENIKSPKQ